MTEKLELIGTIALIVSAVSLTIVAVSDVKNLIRERKNKKNLKKIVEDEA